MTDKSFWAYRDPAYLDSKVICACCRMACDPEEAVQIGDKLYCPDCADYVEEKNNATD